MPVLRDWNLEIDLDMVLRGQGADPAQLRARSPQLIRIAQQALDEGRPLLEPVIVYREYAVKALRHEKLVLEGASLTAEIVPQHLPGVEQLIVMALTIGGRLEELVSQSMRQDPVYALALDGLASAAVEALAAAACRHFEDRAGAQGLETTLPLSPGMEGWPVDVGQQQIFSLVDAGQAGITLTSSSMMIPRKSTSAILGIGKDVATEGRPCDFCAMSKTCRYQQQFDRHLYQSRH